MRTRKRAALISALTDKLHEKHSWVGETHLQKGVYLLEHLLGVPMDVEYILFKHGPFSWQLREELAELRADEVLKLVSQRPPYGPRFYSGVAAESVRSAFPKTLAKYDQQLSWVADQMGPKGVVELERLATALWVSEELGRDAPTDARAKRLNELKPHFALGECSEAVGDIDTLMIEAPIVAAAG